MNNIAQGAVILGAALSFLATIIVLHPVIVGAVKDAWEGYKESSGGEKIVVSVFFFGFLICVLGCILLVIIKR